MRRLRLPNLWFAIPVALATVVGAVLGREVARVTCTFDPDAVAAGRQGCGGLEIAAAILGGVVAFAGVAVVLALAYRSIAEWRESARRNVPPPGPGCETEPADAGGDEAGLSD